MTPSNPSQCQCFEFLKHGNCEHLPYTEPKGEDLREAYEKSPMKKRLDRVLNQFKDNLELSSKVPLAPSPESVNYEISPAKLDKTIRENYTHTPAEKEGWEEEFSKKIGHDDFCKTIQFPNSSWDCNCYLKDSLNLIRQFLTSYRSEVVKKVEGMKRKIPRALDELGRPKTPTEVMSIAEDRGHNAALDAVLEEIRRDK